MQRSRRSLALGQPFPAEIACRGTGSILIDEAALDRLQALRDALGKPLIIRSAYRSPAHNRAVGGAARYLDLNGIEHRRTRIRTPKTNGFVERFNGTVLDEFFRVKMRETFYDSVEALQVDLDAWLVHYNTERPHLGYRNMGRRPVETVMSFVSQEGKVGKTETCASCLTAPSCLFLVRIESPTVRQSQRPPMSVAQPVAFRMATGCKDLRIRLQSERRPKEASMHGEKAAAPPRFAVVDDHRLFASGLAHLLSQPPISAEVELFADPDSLLNGRARHAQAWDMIALDYFIPGRSPTEMIRSARKRFPTARILIVSGSLAPSDRAAALTAGADEFVGKTASFDRLVAVVSELLSKTRTDEKRVIDTPDICAIAEAVGLSTRQLEILSCAAKGLSNKEIALSLAISPETTKTHFAEIFRRLNVRNRVEAIDAARARGLG